MMTERDRAILNQFAAEVRQQFPDAQIWAFGSRARDDAQPDSDLDICVVIEKLDRKAREKISYIAWEIGFDNDLRVTTVKSRQKFEASLCATSPLVLAIRQEGVPARIQPTT